MGRFSKSKVELVEKSKQQTLFWRIGVKFGLCSLEIELVKFFPLSGVKDAFESENKASKAGSQKLQIGLES